jgi:hypothetical protein
MEVPCRPTIRSAIPLLGLHPKESTSAHYRDTYTVMFTTALFTVTNGVLFSYKGQNYVICRKMDATAGHQSEISRTRRETNITHFLSYRESRF